jgi:tight adherence protein B
VYAVGGAVFLGLVILAVTVFGPSSAKRDRIRQIENFRPRAGASSRRPEPSSTSVIARTAVAATAQVVRTSQMEARIGRRLERAGMGLRPAEWVLLRVCVVVTMAALLFSLASFWGGVMGAILGWLVTALYQQVRIDRRLNQFTDQLPDALQLMIGSLRAGFSLPQALEALAREAPQPIGAEFGRALAEHRLGADLSDGLERVAQRTESEDLGWTVMAVRIQREVGGNLAEVLQTTVDTMRERARLRRHVRALSAEGRLSAWILIGLPIGLGLFMFLFRREYMLPLITDPLGLTMLVGGGLLFVVGIFWMLRVIKVDA